DDKQQQGEALLARAKQLLEIRAPGNPAFRLTAKFRLADPSAGSVQGTYQEVWVSPQQWRREINAGSYHQIEISKDKKRWALHTVSFDSYRFDQVRPRLSLPAVDLKLLKVQKIYDKKIGGIPVRCVDINAGEKSGVLFCLDAASGLPVFHEVRMPGRALSAVY